MRFCELPENQDAPENTLVEFQSTEQRDTAAKAVRDAVIQDSKANTEIAKKHDAQNQNLTDDELTTLLGL